MAVNAQDIAADDVAPSLCVDLDGTLVRTDLLLESILALLRQQPLCVFLIPLWFLRGRAMLEREVAARVELNAGLLPYHRELVDTLRAEHAAGRRIWLRASGTDKLAQAVARHLGFFEGVIANDPRAVPAGAAIVQAPSRKRGAWLRPLVKAMRPHQWAKNVLVLVPLAAAHRLSDPASVMNGLLGVIAFCLCASSVYVLNDLLDLEADRAHPRKSKRPFAAGDLSIQAGLRLAAGLFISALVLTLFLPWKFQLVIATYYALTAAYSFALKGIMVVDAVALAGLYTLRVIAGATAVTVALSFWLLLFSVFLFLSLAFVKRYAELDALRRQLKLKALGRGYTVEDLPVLQSLGTAAGYLSVLVLALYINSPDIQALYHRPKAVWLLCVLMLYWVSRVWMTTHRGMMHDDPVVFALRDRVSLGIGALAAVTLAFAI